MKKRHINLPYEDFLKARVDNEQLDRVYATYQWLVPYVMKALQAPEYLDHAEIEEFLTDKLIDCIKRFDGKQRYFYGYAAHAMFVYAAGKIKTMESTEHFNRDVLLNHLADSLDNASIVDDKKGSSYTLKSSLSDESYDEIKEITNYNKPIASNIFKYYLTENEQQIVTLIREGYSLTDIANQMGISKSLLSYRVMKMRGRITRQLNFCKQVQNLIDQGATYSQISKKLGIARARINSYVKMYNCVYLGVEPTQAVSTTSRSI